MSFTMKQTEMKKLTVLALGRCWPEESLPEWAVRRPGDELRGDVDKRTGGWSVKKKRRERARRGLPPLPQQQQERRRLATKLQRREIAAVC